MEPDAEFQRTCPGYEKMMQRGFLSSRPASRRVLLVFALATLLVAGYALLMVNTSADDSKVVISVDKDGKSALKGENVTFVVSLDNQDDENPSQTIKLYASWLTGESDWVWGFTKTNGDPLDEIRNRDDDIVLNGITVPQSTTVDLHFVVYIPADSPSEAREVTIVGLDNFGYLTANLTKQADGTDMSLTVNAVENYGAAISINAKSSNDDKLVFSGQDTTWGYTIYNEGWESDDFTVTSELPADWAISSGIPAGTTILGHSVPDVAHSRAAMMTITPATDARPGHYDLKVIATGDGGASANATFRVTIIAPDFTITNLTLSHSATWITNKDTQTITIRATVLNAGGNVDSAGHATEHIDVWFQVDDETVGDVQYIPSLAHDEEVTVSITFKPSKAGDLLIRASIDEYNDAGDAADVEIQESDEGNNDETLNFKVVKTITTDPSFFLGFAALTFAVLGVVALSTYYRRRS